MEDKPPPHPPNRLLVKLLPYGPRALSEVGLTTAIWWLLGLEGASNALDSLIRRNGIEPEPGGLWKTEVVGVGGLRTDLQYHWGDPPVPEVIVEAKISAFLPHTQLAGYRDRLPADGGLLAILVPGTRRLDGKRVVDQYRRAYPDDPVRLDVWSFDDVADCLEAHLQESSDVAQLRALIETAGALDIPPFENGQLLDDDTTRLSDVLTVFDYATFGLFDQWLPSGRNLAFVSASRNVSLNPYPRFISVGVGLKSPDPTPHPRPWVWLRVSDEPACGPAARAVLAQLRPGAVVRDNGGASVPLKLPSGVAGGEMIQVLRKEIEEIAKAIREALDGLVQTYLAESPEEITLGADSGERPRDIERAVLEATRNLRGGKVGRPHADDSYARNYYIRVEPFETYIAVAFDRKAPGVLGEDASLPWLRAHRATPHAEIAFSVLEELYPHRLVEDGGGLAVPIDVGNAPDPEMATTAYRQLHTTVNAIRRAIFESHRIAPV